MLETPIQFSASDGGDNNYRVYLEAAPRANPVISGGHRIEGWQLFDTARSVYQATVPAGINTRQMFVNGIRARRARGTSRPAGYTKSTSGYTAPTAVMASWGNQKAIELVSFNDWKSFRVQVDRIEGTAIYIQEPAWTLAHTYASLHYGGSMTQQVYRCCRLCGHHPDITTGSHGHRLFQT